VVEGGLVPKSLYLTDENDWDRPLKEDSIYQCVTLTKGQIHEVVLTSEEAGSVITWDFDVLKHDVSFRVVYIAATVEAASPNSGKMAIIKIIIINFQKSTTLLKSSRLKKCLSPTYSTHPIIYFQITKKNH
jgi:hypothetical protein